LPFGRQHGDVSPRLPVQRVEVCHGALPLLERAGLRGWFFIPTSFIEAPVPEQHAFARAHHIGLTDDDQAGGRCAMTWDELRYVVFRGHVVACHTATH